MVCQAKGGDASFERSSAVLMARLVDREGTEIRPSDVRSIAFSLYEVDSFWPEHLTAVGGRCDVPLPVAMVLFDGLQAGAPWRLDDVGYNFRHEIRLGRHQPLPKALTRYEVRYEFEMTSGEKACVRFSITVRNAAANGASIEHRALGESNDRH